MSDAARMRTRGGPLVSTAEGSWTAEFGSLDWGLFSFCALVWGASFYFIAVGVDHFSPPVVGGLRLVFGCAVLAVVPRARAGIAREDQARLWLPGLVWIGIPFLLFPIAEQYVASSVAGMINAGVPVFTVIFATALLHRLPGRTQMIGLLVGLAGVAIVTIPSAGEGRSSALGVALLVVAV